MNYKERFTGGDPDMREDDFLRGQETLQEALHAIINGLNLENPCIISGCEITVNGDSSINITEGYIFIDNQVVKVDAQSNVPEVGGSGLFRFTRQTSYDPLGDKTFIDGIFRQTFRNERGVAEGVSSLGVGDLSVYGPSIANLLKRTVASGYEEFTNTSTIADDTMFVKYTMNAGATHTLTIPDADDITINKPYIFIEVFYTDGTLNIKNATGITLATVTGTNSGVVLKHTILLVNDDGTWRNLIDIESPAQASTAQAQAQSLEGLYICPNTLGDVCGGLLKTVVNIGDWNMDSVSQVVISSPVDVNNIRSINVLIRDDTDNFYRPLNRVDTSGNLAGSCTGLFAITNQIELSRVTGGFYDSTNYDSTSFNRGWIVLEHV